MFNGIIDRLADSSLKRVYKYILKKAIGEYLVEDLTLEQLNVESRCGRITVNDLAFDVEKINSEHLNNSIPFMLKSVHIETLEGQIQYTTILTEGCSLRFNDITIVLVPRTETTSSNAAVSTFSAQTDEYKDSDNETDNDDLSFIAEWVDIIVSRMKVDATNINIIVVSESSSIHFCFHLDRVAFSYDYRESVDTTQPVAESHATGKKSVMFQSDILGPQGGHGVSSTGILNNSRKVLLCYFAFSFFMCFADDQSGGVQRILVSLCCA